MQSFKATPVEMGSTFWRHRQLIYASAKREVISRYRGSIMGILWSFLNPLFMLAVYTVVFSVVFQARWGTGNNSKTEFALVLFAGLIIFNLFSECINRAPTLIISNANFVKKVIYPLEILPAITLTSAAFQAIISLCVWLLAYVTFFGIPQSTALLLPLILMPFLLFTLGLSWALASLGVYLRDVSQLIGVTTSVLMFLSPIFYPVEALPQEFRILLYFNPLTPAIEMTRDVLYWGRVPDGVLLTIYWVANITIAWVGFAWFQKTRKGFADVI